MMRCVAWGSHIAGWGGWSSHLPQHKEFPHMWASRKSTKQTDSRHECRHASPPRQPSHGQLRVTPCPCATFRTTSTWVADLGHPAHQLLDIAFRPALNPKHSHKPPPRQSFYEKLSVASSTATCRIARSFPVVWSQACVWFQVVQGVRCFPTSFPCGPCSVCLSGSSGMARRLAYQPGCDAIM